MKNNKAFTFIELLIALAVIAVCFLPLINMLIGAMEQVQEAQDLSIATSLAQEQMEKVRNLNFTKAQLVALGDVWEPALEEGPLVMNSKKWRTLRKIFKKTDPLEVHVQVFKVLDGGNILPEKPVVEVVTLIEDLEW